MQTNYYIFGGENQSTIDFIKIHKLQNLIYYVDFQVKRTSEYQSMGNSCRIPKNARVSIKNILKILWVKCKKVTVTV